MITDPHQIGYEIDKALFLAQNGRKGPVWIDVPLDVQNKRIDLETLSCFKPHSKPEFEPTRRDVNFILDSIKISRRPSILIGSGIRSAEAIEELESFPK